MYSATGETLVDQKKLTLSIPLKVGIAMIWGGVEESGTRTGRRRPRHGHPQSFPPGAPRHAGNNGSEMFNALKFRPLSLPFAPVPLLRLRLGKEVLRWQP